MEISEIYATRSSRLAKITLVLKHEQVLTEYYTSSVE